MVPYFLMIDHVLSSNSQVLACVIPTMERSQGGISAFFYITRKIFWIIFCSSIKFRAYRKGVPLSFFIIAVVGIFHSFLV
jgi:hypothetical protein